MYTNEINEQRKITLDCIKLAYNALNSIEENNPNFKGTSLAMNVIRLNVQHELPKNPSDATSSTLQMLDSCDIMLMLISNITNTQVRIIGKLLYELSFLKELYRKQVYQVPKKH